MRRACLVLPLILLPAVVAQGAPPAVLAVDAVCLPQLAECVPTSDPCAGLAAPDATVSLRVHATRGGEPLALARLHADGRTAWTSQSGHARVPFDGDAGAALLRVALADDTAAVSHPLRRAGLAVHLVDPPAVADALDPPSLRVRVVDAATGTPVEGARVLAQIGEGSLDIGPTDADGLADARLSASEEPEQVVAMLDAERCGLPALALPEPYALSWRVPALEPLPVLTLYPPSGWVGGPIFELHHSTLGPRPPHRLEWRVAGGEWQPEPILLQQGAHVVEARVHDAVGRTSNLTRAVVRVDASPPHLTLPSGWTSCAPLPIGAGDAHAGLAWSRLFVDGAEVSPTARLADGPHDVRLEAMDAVGHRSHASAVVQCDGDAPTLTATDFGAWSRCTHASWTVRDGGSGVSALSATLDGRPATVVREAGTARVPLPEGESVVALRARDGAGNLRESVVSARCDRSPPTLDLVPESPTRVAATAHDAHSGLVAVRMRVDEGPWTTAGAVDLEGEGTRVVQAEATDGVDHVAVASREFVVDRLAPRLSAPERVPVGSAFEIVVQDASPVSVERAMGDAWVALEARAPGRYGIQLGNETAGSVVLVRARDETGNVAAVEILVAARAALPAAPPTETLPPATADAPPAVSHEPVPAPVRVESVVVTVLPGSGANDVRLTGVAEGIRAGEAFLVASDGTRTPLGPVVVEEGLLRLEARSRLAGTYDLELELTTVGGAMLRHDSGSVTLAGTAGETRTVGAASRDVPGPGLLGLLAVAGVAAAGRRKR